MNRLKEKLEQELAIVEDYISFLDKLRHGPGYLYIPDELAQSFETSDDDTSFEEELIEAMLHPIEDPVSDASFLPFIIRGPESLKDKITYLDPDSEFRKTLCARAYDIKSRIEQLDTGE